MSVSYAAAHRRHRQALAGGHCAHCGVLQVALKADVPAERLLVGTGRAAGLLYSLESSDYELRCTRHHVLSDSRNRRIRKLKAVAA